MSKSYTASITNKAGRPYAVHGGCTVGPGETVSGVVLREQQLAPLRTNQGLAVEIERVHEDEQPKVNAKQAEQQLADAGEALEAAREHERQLTAKLANLERRVQAAEAEEIEGKRRAALEGQSIAAVAQASEVSDLRGEAEQVNYELWAARIGTARAEAGVHEARGPVATAKGQKLKRALATAEQRVSDAVTKRDAIRDEYRRIPDAFSLKKKARATRQRAGAIEAEGPHLTP